MLVWGRYPYACVLHARECAGRQAGQLQKQNYSVSIKYVKVDWFQGMLQAGKVVCFSLLTHFCS